MKRLFIRCICFLVLTCCESVTHKTEKEEGTVRDPAVNPIEATTRKKIFYAPKSKSVLDSTLNKNKVYSRFKTSVEALKKLDPQEGIEFYLKGAIRSTEELLNVVLVDPYEVPAVKSRLRVVKTHLLRSRYYTQEEDIESLNSALNDLFDSYNILLMRIDDIAQNDIDLEKNKFEVEKKKIEKLE
tara:strand:+ start:4156 stop:4710 length:555 start_codon:yes stop_codon:yes gene_type:complete